ncbi:DALR anticodon-binding domain-containing protein [Phytohabitans sp. ZYX-F-186]|uniref:DALR anticodon-binding domain-containing protein n=1 Tax=Phytohabitans maris TaxID=3071409 RepID=A0ABU0Z8V8_9ACTN|nr:DALR anticodon-binding domain-containing protein [Phytohabitans sp. ZYX-F-186]MDQ7903490.1 DALR anticodon-binding domain-containing protein [Phytohabitans sp. ZYX-F-186]
MFVSSSKPRLVYEGLDSGHHAFRVSPAEHDARGSRLALCDLTARVPRHGLHLLGIATRDRM